MVWKAGLGLLLGTLPTVARAQWALRGEIGVRHDDNAGNAHESDDVVALTSTFLGLDLTNAYYLSDTLSLRYGARLRGESFDRASGLNNVSLGLEGALRRKWGLGPAVPWTELGLSAAREEFRADLRTGWRYQAALRGGKRLGPSVDLWAGIWAERREAQAGEPEAAGLSGDAFSQSAAGFDLNAEFALGQDLFFTASYLHRRGDVTFNSTGELDEYPEARAAAVDPALGPGFFAYKEPGRSYGGRGALVYALNGRAALGLAFERQVTSLDSGPTYGRNFLTGSFKYRF